MNIKHRHFRQNIRTRYTALIVIQINKINNICIHRNNKLAKIECSLCETSYVENKSVFNCFLNCVMLLLSRMFLGSLFHRVGPAQTNARRPKRSRLTLGTSSSNPPAERSERGGVWRRSSAARYSGVPLYMALCTSTSSLKSIRFLTGNQCVMKTTHDSIRFVVVVTS